MNKHTSLFFLLAFIFSIGIIHSCKNESGNKVMGYANSTFYEPGMIINYQGDNSIEGDYIRIKKVVGDTLFLDSLPKKLIQIGSPQNWVVGWGDGVKLKNTGVENLHNLKLIVQQKAAIILGKHIRGGLAPHKGDFICLYNTQASGFQNYKKEPIFNWSSNLSCLAEKSMVVAKVVYDKGKKQFAMFVNEVDSDTLQTFVLTSVDLKKWQIENKGKALIYGADYGWNSLSRYQRDHFSAILTDVINFKGMWYFAMTTIDVDKKKQISIYASPSLYQKPMQLITRDAINNTMKGRENGVFYPKLLTYNDRVQMYYTGIGDDGEEHIYGSYSNDMKLWKDAYSKPFVYGHTGWRSEKHASEVAAVIAFSDTVVLFVQGAKAHNAGFMSRYVFRNEYAAMRGNVSDSEIGMFFSKDGGLTFSECNNNPVFINDYTSIYEDDHLGMSLDLIHKNDTSFLFYSAKSTSTGRYQPFLKVRKKAKPNF